VSRPGSSPAQDSVSAQDSAPAQPTGDPAARTWTEHLRERWFGDDEHPYTTYERRVRALLREEHTLLEGGCGYGAEILRKYRGLAARRIGIDRVEFRPEAVADGIELHRGDMARTGLPDGSVDLIMSRAVLEHLEHPLEVFREVQRILRPGGHFVFLTANIGDYASWISMAIPNRLHPLVVRLTEGRDEADTFPAFYRCNSRRSLARLCRDSDLELASLEYLGQYPCYFMFNPLLFAAASGYEKLISRVEALRFLRGWLLGVVTKPLPTPADPGPGAT
jgi:SAM-dependent methyltransferase